MSIKSVTIFLNENNKKVIKTEDKPNYTVEDYKNPPEKDIQKDENNKPMYRKKVVYGKDGKKRILTVAVMKDEGPQGGKTEVTSKWKEK